MIFPDLPEVDIEQVNVADEITLTLCTTSRTASCPSCGTASQRTQSRYTRRLRDLPSNGRPVHLVLHVRRFSCKKNTCVQKIFAERLPELCHPHAQRTLRLQEALSQLGLVVGGQAGARIGSETFVSAAAVIPSCAWFATIPSLILLSRESLGWMTGHGSADSAMGP